MARKNKVTRVLVAKSNRPKPPVHVGHLVWRVLINGNQKRTVLAKATNRSLTTISRQLRKPSMQIAELFEFCHAVKHNFFYDLAASLPAEYSSATLQVVEKHTAMEEEISKLLQENELLKQENNKLNERVDLLIKKL